MFFAGLRDVLATLSDSATARNDPCSMHGSGQACACTARVVGHKNHTSDTTVRFCITVINNQKKAKKSQRPIFFLAC